MPEPFNVLSTLGMQSKEDAMPGLSRDEIIAAIAARKTEVDQIEVPEWGGTVYVRRISSGDADSAKLFEGEATEITLKLLVMCLSDAEGNRLFTTEDMAALAEGEFPVVMRVFAEVAKMNGLAEAGLEESTANFAAAQPAASSSS